MYKVSIEALWQIDRRSDGRAAASLDTARLLRLLAQIKQHGSIAGAVAASGLSYRHGWGLLREAEQLFGTGLLIKRQGRGTSLSPLGETLLLADQRIRARLSPMLDSLAAELEGELGRSVTGTGQALRLYASHGFAVASLSEWLHAARKPVEIRYRNSVEAVAALAGRECDLAGFHVPLGEFEAEAAKAYTGWLVPDKHVLIHLAGRQQGLIVARGNPLQIHGLTDLQRKQVRFVNRQPGSGTRMLLELMLKKARIAASAINGFENTDLTHAAVAAYIASGMADASLGVETAARRFGLDFVPLVRERYFFAAEKAMLGDAPMVEMLEILRSSAFRDRISALPGYDAANTGEVLSLPQAFGRAR